MKTYGAAPIPRILHLAALDVWKFLVTRSTRILLLISLIVSAGLIAASVLIGLSGPAAAIDAATTVGSLTLIVSVAASLAGVLIFASDWQHREIISVFLLDPRRLSTYFAKLIAAIVIALSAAIVVIAISLSVTLAISAITGTPWQLADLSAAIAALIASSLIGAMTGAALASVLLSVPLAIVAVFVQALVVEVPLALLPGPVPGYFRPSAVLDFFTRDGSAAQALTSAGLWILVPLTFGYLRHLNRDAT